MILQRLIFKKYFLSIIFFSDLISTVSLILDLNMIYFLIVESKLEIENNQLKFKAANIQSNLNLTNYIHVIRYFRLTRLLSWIKLFKEYHKKQFYLKAGQNKKENLGN